MGSRFKFVCSTSTYWDLHYRANFYKFERNTVVIFSLGSVFCRGSRTPYWGLEQSPSWMPASSRKGKSSGGEGPAGPWHRDGHRVRSANQTSRLERKLHWLQCSWFSSLAKVTYAHGWYYYMPDVLAAMLKSWECNASWDDPLRTSFCASPMLCIHHKLNK